MKLYAFGVDIGGTTVKTGLFRTDGTLLETWEIPTRTQEDGKYILRDIAETIEQKMEDKQIAKSDVEGIGIGIPGPVGPDGTVLKCVNLGWGVFNVEDALKQITGLKVKAGNDANVAALGELWQGGGKGYQNIVMVTLGTGVGGGIIIGGRILPGIHGAAGEIGHIPVRDGETKVCACGNRGCLEQYASANGLVRITEKYLAENLDEPTVLRGVVDLSAKDICDAAKEGDPAALAMVHEIGALLGKALASVACVADPEAFVIGGGMSKAGEFLLEIIREHYREHAFHASRGTDFKQAALSNLAGIYGGVKLVL